MLKEGAGKYLIIYLNKLFDVFGLINHFLWLW